MRTLLCAIVVLRLLADVATPHLPGAFQFDPDEAGVLPDEPADSSLWSESDAPGRTDPWSGDDRPAEIADQSRQSLHEHLSWQLQMEHFTPREALIGEALVDYINDHGYLTETL